MALDRSGEERRQIVALAGRHERRVARCLRCDGSIVEQVVGWQLQRGGVRQQAGWL